MIQIRILAVLPLCLLLAACATPPTGEKVPPASFSRVGVIVVASDEATVTSASSYFAFPKSSRTELPGLQELARRVTEERFDAAGYDAVLIPIEARTFWSAFEDAKKKKGGSDWHLAAKSNAQIAVQILAEKGDVDIQRFDLIVVIGPTEFYSGAVFLSPEETLISFSTLATKPGLVGLQVSACVQAIRVPELETMIWRPSMKGADLGIVEGADAELRSMTEQQRLAFVALIEPHVATMVDDLIKRIQ